MNNFDKIVNAIHQKKRITSQQADNAKEQYDDLVVVQNATKFENFDMKVNRLDEFVGNFLIGTKYTDLWYICIYI